MEWVKTFRIICESEKPYKWGLSLSVKQIAVLILSYQFNEKTRKLWIFTKLLDLLDST